MQNIINIVFLIVAGTWAQIAIQRPAEIVYKLSQNATFPCEFIHTPVQQVEKNPIIYWHNMFQSNMTRLWPTSGLHYKDRVEVLDSDLNSRNRSLLLKNVQWEDSEGKYECKLSYRAGGHSARTKGNGTKLLIYDSLSFHPVNNTLLCAVNVSWDPRFVLSVRHKGSKASLVRSATGPFQLITPLSISLPLEKNKDYECQLNLSSTVLLNQTFKQPVETSEKELPEPVFLFVAILLVPITVFLALLIAVLKKV
ncbi:uncharacterized protein LOC105031109 [Esox lucius]|uniref:uncharacterized protein LOC105031109 n=1 Tax=Esox lucius TaxID=8010 RepID=UPI0005770E0F|nr:uncharacterized protein LOC105031109 [Esox lucius]